MKYLRTKIRSLEKPLKKSGIEYNQIIKSINNLATSQATLDSYFIKIFKKLIKKSQSGVFINFKEFIKLNNETKIALINESIKKIKKNYYNLRAKKVSDLITRLEKTNFKITTLGGCIFYKKKDKLCLKIEKL